jgi:hypothetical protein
VIGAGSTRSRLLALAALGALALAGSGCDAILDVHPHGLAPGDGGEGNGLPIDAGYDGAPGAPGGPVASVLCNDAGACVAGGLLSVGRVPDDAGATTPDGATVRVTDDGFDFGATSCDPTGVTCVTGAITP